MEFIPARYIRFQKNHATGWDVVYCYPTELVRQIGNSRVVAANDDVVKRVVLLRNDIQQSGWGGQVKLGLRLQKFNGVTYFPGDQPRRLARSFGRAGQDQGRARFFLQQSPAHHRCIAFPAFVERAIAIVQRWVAPT